MKKILFAIIICSSAASISAQTKKGDNHCNASYRKGATLTAPNSNYVKATVDQNGNVTDNHFSNVGQIHSDGTVTDSHFSTIGQIHSNGEITDSHFSTIGRINSQGEITDRHFRTVGHLKDGVLTDEHNSVIGHGMTKEAAALFFFFNGK